jgi:hypothetical protein
MKLLLLWDAVGRNPAIRGTAAVLSVADPRRACRERPRSAPHDISKSLGRGFDPHPLYVIRGTFRSRRCSEMDQKRPTDAVASQDWPTIWGASSARSWRRPCYDLDARQVERRRPPARRRQARERACPHNDNSRRQRTHAWLAPHAVADDLGLSWREFRFGVAEDDVSVTSLSVTQRSAVRPQSHTTGCSERGRLTLRTATIG